MNTSSAPPPSAELLPFEAVERTLPNGLKVIVVPTGFPNVVSLQIPVQVGSRHETEPGLSGFAHFFEHMMFRGTPSHPPERYQGILTRAGARQNAYTADDFTNYHVTFAKEDLETILRIEADRFQNLEYSEEAFKTEARAVLGEYNKNSADPFNRLLEVQREHAFQLHPYKHTPMGFLRDIEEMPRHFAYSRRFFARWYRPEHTTLIVAGDVGADEVLPLVEQYWGGWKPGAAAAEIPQEPPPRGPVYARVPWPAATLPWVSVAFHGPAFSETEKDFAALDVLFDLTFGPTSDLYRRMVEQEQKLDQLFAYVPANADPGLVMVAARVKDAGDAVYVRDRMLEAVAAARAVPVPAQRLADAQSNGRYGLLRSLDGTEEIAATLARFVRFRRSYDTLDAAYRLYAALTPDDLLEAARRHLTDERLVVAALAHEALPEAMARPPRLAELAPAAAAELKLVVQQTALPVIHVKLTFTVGSAHDPEGRQGLAALAAAMIADAGSRLLRVDEINRALYPMAAGFTAQVDKEMTTFTGVVHREHWSGFLDLVLPKLLDPGFRDEDFQRLKDAQRYALVLDLRASNEEELGKEVLQSVVFAGTPYAHPPLGTVAGIDALGLDDVRGFVKTAYTRANLTVGLAGDLPHELAERLRRELAALPAGPEAAPPRGVLARRPQGLQVEIVEKGTRATALSLGHPIEVTRAHPDFAALWVAAAWLGEHRNSMARLYQRIREARGLNYGDYAYIEAFPRGMFQFFPDANLARRAQLFEIWIRPVLPDNAHMALRIALDELRRLVDGGLTAEQFEATREYLMKNVYLMTAGQDLQLGYALDARWHGIGDFAATMRERLRALTLADVNAAVKRHLSGHDLFVVAITEDARGLAQRLIADAFSPVSYDAPKPELRAEDERIGSIRLGVREQDVRITAVDEVFAR